MRPAPSPTSPASAASRSRRSAARLRWPGSSGPCGGAPGTATVAVQLRHRPWVAVLADMIDGVLAVNALRGAAADEVRTALWQAVEGAVVVAA
jgi:hypothetical protein